MLPPGHIAAGFIAAKVLLHFSHQGLSQVQQTQLVWLGMVFAFIPDLDSFVAFSKEKAWFVKNQKNHHRKLISHAPLLWFLAGMAIYFFSSTIYYKDIGLLLWLSSWSHFVLDSIEYGIMWLWPFSHKVYALRNRETDFKNPYSSFFKYWVYFVKSYSKTITFYCEILIIISALIYYIR